MNLYGYTLETAGALDGGRKVWALAKTRMTDAVGDDGKDGLAAYVLLATSCDRTLATTAAFTSVRVVCSNTLFFAVDDIKTGKRPQVKVPHNVRFDADQVRRELGLLNQAWSAFIERVRKMAKYPMKPEIASDYFDLLLGKTDTKPLSSRAEREQKTIMALFNSAPGQHLDTAKGTLWGAVNAVTYYTDHIRPGSDGTRLDSSWFGAGCALKDKAWAKASDLVA